MTNDYFDYHIPYMTTRIMNTQTKKMGTGFFYNVKLPKVNGKNYSRLLLVSNRHVLQGNALTETECTIRLTRKKENGAPDFGEIKTVNKVWDLYTHHDPDVDLACIDVSDIRHTNAFYEHLGENILTPIDYKQVTIGKEILFVGYPTDYYDHINNLPLGRKGFISSKPDVNFYNKSEIVIDAQVFPGSSGSPVFVYFRDKNGKEKYSLIGVLSHWIKKPLNLESLPETILQHLGITREQLETILEDLGIKESIGLGIVIKQEKVKELIEFFKDFVIKNLP